MENANELENKNQEENGENKKKAEALKKKFSIAIKSDAYKNMINNTLGDKELSREFIANITTVVSNNQSLQNCDAGSIISAGLMASSLKLPLSPTLGFAYVIPYGNKAQFQIGYKGLIQICLRSNVFSTLGVRPVHKGEYQGQNEFGEDEFKFSHDFDSEEVVGYFAYFKLTNGFKKTLYWTKKQCEKHGRKYSKSYSNLWTSDFDKMSEKTVLKMLLGTYAPMNVDLSKAVQADQAVIKEDGTYDYVDNAESEAEKPQKKGVSNSIIEEAKPIETEPETGEIIDDDKPF